MSNLCNIILITILISFRSFCSIHCDNQTRRIGHTSFGGNGITFHFVKSLMNLRAQTPILQIPTPFTRSNMEKSKTSTSNIQNSEGNHKKKNQGQRTRVFVNNIISITYY